MRADAEVTTPLYPHQEEALAWMVARENSNQLPPFWGAPCLIAARAPNFVCLLEAKPKVLGSCGLCLAPKESSIKGCMGWQHILAGLHLLLPGATQVLS